MEIKLVEEEGMLKALANTRQYMLRFSLISEKRAFSALTVACMTLSSGYMRDGGVYVQSEALLQVWRGRGTKMVDVVKWRGGEPYIGF